MAAQELVAYLETGNIKNSVNYPSVEMPHHDGIRLVILHRNIPNMLSHISSTLSENSINIENLTSRSKGNYAVTLVDVLSEITEATIATIQSMEGIIRVLKID
jgi:D-3-phosphoglycerate dehydrogenase